MKAQRRHELKTNALASKIVKLPDIGRQIAGRIITGALLALVVFLAVWYYFRDQAQVQAQLVTQLNTARNQAEMVSQMPAISRRELEQSEELRQTLNNIENKASDPAMKAEAYLIEADLDWQLGNLPPAPTTQPAAAPQVDRSRQLDLAQTLYETVVQNFHDQPVAYARAELGLAAVAEDKHDWAAARTAYENVTNDKRISPAFAELATARVVELPGLEHPIPLAPPPPVLKLNATNPSTTQSSATEPAARPIGAINAATNPAAVLAPPVASATKPGESAANSPPTTRSEH